MNENEQSGGTEGRKIDPEVPEKAKRRRFLAEYKLRILEEADRCVDPGQIGELLRLPRSRRFDQKTACYNGTLTELSALSGAMSVASSPQNVPARVRLMAQVFVASH